MPKDYNFVSCLLDEIALEGLDGITLEMLWQRLRDRPNFPIPVDEDSKNFFWRVVAMHKDLEIYELPSPRKFYPIYNRYEHIDPELGIVVEPEKLDPDPYAPVVPINDGDVRGSCSTYDKRKCITSEIRHDNILLMSLQEAVDTWGDSLVLVGSPKLRLLSLIGTVTNPLVHVSLEAYCLLERIGRSRYLGEVTQGEGGLLSLKASFCRQLHYYRKKLTLQGLVTKQNHYMKNKKGTTCTGSLFHLTRFYVLRKTKMANWMKCLCDILKDKPQNQEACKVLKEEMKIPDRTFKKLFYRHFHKWVKLVTLTCQEFYPYGTHKDWFTVNGQPKLVKVCQLLRHCEEEVDEKEEEEEVNENKSGTLPLNIHFDSSKIHYGIPLVHQLYGHIKDAGSEGVSAGDLGRTMTLPRLDVRGLLTLLCRKGHITSVLQDRGRQKVKKYIAQIYADQNTDYSSLKDQDMILAKKPGQVNGHSGNHSSSKRKGSDIEGTDNEAPSSKRARIDQENDEISVPASDTANQNDRPKVSEVDSNYQNIVSQVLELQNESHFTGKAPKVVSFSESPCVPPPYAGTTQLTSRKLKRSGMILEYVKSERLTTLSDLQKHIIEKEREEGYRFKLDKKSTARLVYSLYNNKKIKIFKGVIKLDDEQTEIEFMCDNSLDKSDPLIQVAIEQAKFKYFGVSKKSSNKTHDNKLETSSSVPNSNSAASTNKTATSKEKPAKRQVSKQLPDIVTKYPHMTPKFLRAKALHSFLYYLVYKHKGNPTNTEEQIIYHDAVNWRRFVPPLHEGTGEGWVYLSDIYSRMPLSLFVKIVHFNHGFPGLSQYLEKEEKSHYLIKFLPQNLRNNLMNNRKYLFSTNEVIKILCYLGLVSIGPSAGKQKDQLFLYVHKHASIRDTTISPPGYVHIKEDLNYELKSYTFETEDDVETFWLDLENIAFHTSLGKFSAAAGKIIRITEADYKPELILTTKHKQFNKVVDDGRIPGDGLGAGGFDSSLYLHCRRNWQNTATTQPIKNSQKPYPKRDTALVSIQNLLKHHNEKPSSETRTRLQRLTKNVLLTQKDKKLALIKPSDKKKVVVSAAKFPSKRERTKIRTVKMRHTKKRAPYYDEKDKAAMMKMDKARCTWTSQEDSFLLLCKVASSFLDPHYCKNLVVPYTVVRDLLYKQVPDISENKTSRACQRRLRYMMLNPETINNVNVFLGEALQDDELVKEFNLAKPPKTNEEVWASMFTTVVKKLLEKFTSSASERCKNFVLPNSREELEKLYELKSYYKTNQNCKDLYKAPKSVEDIRKFVLSTLILSAMAVTDDTEWSYLLHKLYQCFPDNYISFAVSSLRKAGILAVKKRSYKADLKRSLQSSGPYKFSVNYSNAMLTKFPVKIFKEAEKLFGKLKSLEPGVDEELIGDVPPGFAAAVLSLMQTKQLYIETRIPSQIILFDSSLSKEARSNIVERMINTLSDKESTELSRLLNNDSIPTTTANSKEDTAKEQSAVVCETDRDDMCNTDLSLMDNSQMTEVQRFASASRFALYLLRQEMSQPPKEKVQHAQDYIVLNSCSVVCHLEPTDDIPVLPIIPVGIIENSTDKNTPKTNKEAICITKDKMFLTSDTISKISQQLVRFIPAKSFLQDQNYLNQIGLIYKNCASNTLLDARRIFNAIHISGEVGITEKEIWKKFRVLSGKIALFEHLDIFQKSGLVIRAGIVEFNYVCGCFAKNYVLPTFRSAHLPTKSKNRAACSEIPDSISESSNTSILPCSETNFNSKDVQSTEADQSMCTEEKVDEEQQMPPRVSGNNLRSSNKTETHYFIPRTWRNPNGALNKPTFFSLLSTVLSHIISNPGISSFQVCEQFSLTLPPVQTLELIEILEKTSCVYKYYCKPLKKKSLFSAPRTISVTKNPEPEDVDHIEPFPDAVCKIADLRCTIE